MTYFKRAFSFQNMVGTSVYGGHNLPHPPGCNRVKVAANTWWGTSPHVPKPTGAPVFYWQNATKIEFSTMFLGMLLMILRFQDRGNSGRVGREGLM